MDRGRDLVGPASSPTYTPVKRIINLYLGLSSYDGTKVVTGYIYRALSQAEWAAAEAAGVYQGHAHDVRDGFLHFSTAAQLAETLARHYAGRDGLVLLEVDPAALGGALKWEPSRGGDLFPHLYAGLTPAMVRRVIPAPLGADGKHVVSL